MIEVDEFLKQKKVSDDVRLLSQVHDELVYEIKVELVDTYASEIQRIMQSVIDPKKPPAWCVLPMPRSETTG